MDDGFYVGSIEEAEHIWKTINKTGPKFGFTVNSKSKIFVKQEILLHIPPNLLGATICKFVTTG